MPDSTAITDPPLMLDRSDLAHHLRVDTRTIDRWRSEGYLPAPTIAKGAKVRLWSRAVIEQWILEQDKGR